MSDGTLSRAHDLGRSPLRREHAALSDRQLLSAFVSHNDEEAFADLVRRHGPMVLGVCRRLLGHVDDAADAFQAVFLVLVRKAASIRSAEVLGSWLYNVAVRTSLKARTTRRRRQARETLVSVMPEGAVEADESSDEVLALLDEELRALPERYQQPVILCELEGRSRKEVAATLKLSEGTLSSRLATARKKLAERLRRRGVVVSLAALGTLLAPSVASASMPAGLVLTTVKAATLYGAGHAATGLISTEAMALAQGVLKSMLLAKLKLATATVLLLGVLAGAAQVGLPSAGDAADDEASAVAALEKLGAKIKRAETQPGKPVIGVDLKDTKVTDTDLRHLPLLAQLQTLDLRGTAVTDAGLKHLPPLVQLHWLDLADAHVSDAGLQEIAALTKLQTLNVSRTELSDAGLQHLAALKELRMLWLAGTKVTDAGLQTLTPLSKLFILDLSKTAVTDAGLKDLTAFKSLQKLELTDTAVTDAGLKDLAVLTTLERLILNRTAVTDAGVKQLAPLSRLAWLSLERTQVTEACLPGLAGFKRLRILNLSNAKITDAGVKDLVALSQLNSLGLHRTALTDAGVKGLAPLKDLHTIWLSWTKITDDGVKELTNFKKLHTVRLGGTKVTDAGLRDLAALKDLQDLSLDFTQVTDAGLKELAGLTKLKVLKISDTPVTDAGLKELSLLKKLHKLDVQGTQVTEDGAKKLQTQLPQVAVNTKAAAAATPEPEQARAFWWLLAVVVAAAGLTASGLVLWRSHGRRSARVAAEVECPNCRKHLKLHARLVGKKVKCPGCAAAFVA